MGLNEKKFKQFNNLIKNKKFLNSLVSNVEEYFIFYQRKDKFTSVILNYDEKSDKPLFKWYQQLVAESLGKKSKGILTHNIFKCRKIIIAVMQLYLDGPKNKFLYFFSYF